LKILISGKEKNKFNINGLSLNVFDDGAELLVSVFWTLSIVIMFFQSHYVSRDGSSTILR
jgi:hypothetical protein